MRRHKIAFAISALVVVVFAAVVLLFGGTEESSDSAAAETPETTMSTTVDEGEEPEECETWTVAEGDHAGNRWIAEGIPSIASATNEEEARAAASEWLDSIKPVPALLSGTTKVMLEQDVEQGDLFDEEGCATDVAVDLVAELEAVIALSLVKPEEAPTHGYNSGVHDGVAVASATAGIGGNRSAILIEMPDGTKIWIMARCGNPVKEGPPGLPAGPTDNPPPEETPPQPPPPPEGGKDHRKSPVSDDPDDPEERVRPNVPAPPEVIRPPTTAPPPASTPTTEPAKCGTATTPPCGSTGVTSPPTTAPPPAPPTTESPTTPVTSP